MKIKNSENKEAITNLFNLADMVADSNPSSEICQTLLEGMLKIVHIIEDPALAKNFEGHWKDFKKNIKPYTEPSVFEFHENEIENNLQTLLA
jgi:hypothetical protein